MVLLFLALFAAGCVRQARTAGDAPGRRTQLPAVDTIALERTRCFGACPVYRVAISTGGTAVFESIFARKRSDTTRVSIRAIRALLSELQQAGFMDLDSGYVAGHALCPSPATDFPSATMTLRWVNGSKHVRHYHGCFPPGAPPGELHNPGGTLALLMRLQDRIDSVAGTSAWLRRRY